MGRDLGGVHNNLFGRTRIMMRQELIYEESEVELLTNHLSQLNIQENVLRAIKNPENFDPPPPPMPPNSNEAVEAPAQRRTADGHGWIANFSRKAREDLRRTVGYHNFHQFRQKFLKNGRGTQGVGPNSQLLVLFCFQFIRQTNPSAFSVYSEGIQVYLNKKLGDAMRNNDEEGYQAKQKLEALERLMRLARQYYCQGLMTSDHYLGRLREEGQVLFRHRQEKVLTSELLKLRRHIQGEEIDIFLAPPCIDSIQGPQRG